MSVGGCVSLRLETRYLNAIRTEENADIFLGNHDLYFSLFSCNEWHALKVFIFYFALNFRFIIQCIHQFKIVCLCTLSSGP